MLAKREILKASVKQSSICSGIPSFICPVCWMVVEDIDLTFVTLHSCPPSAAGQFLKNLKLLRSNHIPQNAAVPVQLRRHQ